MSRRYFTTPIYYVNDRPHIGHLYTNVVTDVLARYARFSGHETRFLTGTDEHGRNMEKVARAEGVEPIVVADRNSETFRALARAFRIANDDFIRTTDRERHFPGVIELIRRIEANGDFELARHEGWYCPGCEAFYPEKDLVDGACPTHLKKLEWAAEENVFFRLDRYQQRLLDHYAAHPEFVFPDTRRNEVLSFVSEGLKPLSVSRTTIRWGIPFPGKPGHVVYVWLDALTNYISALGFGRPDDALFQRFWPQPGNDARAVHVVGKDILRFHAVYWPAFLMAAGVATPSQVISHGWWLRDEQKMSKSLGNVVRPDELVQSFGVDALRWHLISEMTFGQDASFSDEAFLARYNADLANGLGNTLSRAVKMAADALGNRTSSERCDDNEVRTAAIAAVGRWRAAFDGYRLHEAADVLRGLLSAIDGYISAKEPWKRVKQEGVTPALHRIHHNTLEGLRIAAVLLAPVAPGAAEQVLRRIGAPRKAEELTPQDLEWGGLPLESPIAPEPPLFPRADQKLFFAEAAPDGAAEIASAKAPATRAADRLAKEASVDQPTAAPAPETKPRISIEEFQRLELRVAEVLEAEKVPKSKKLMRMSIRIGDEVRTIVAGIATAYTAEQLVGRKIVVVANLEPAKLMGIESNGMVLAATIPDTGEASLLAVDPSVPSGAKVK